MKKYNKPETEILNMDAVLDREEDDLFKSPDLESILQSGK